MRFILQTFAVFAFGLTVLTACQNTAKPLKIETVKTNSSTVAKPDEHGDAEEAPRITLAEAKKDFDEGKVIFVDTRSNDQYKQEHIKGAINVPANEIEAKYKEIPTDKKIIAYCS